MTEDEAKRHQAYLAKHYNLSWWYGTDCATCCGVYPKLMTEGNLASADVYYQCEVCGRRTKGCVMPWVARDEWNAGRFIAGGQLSFF